MMYAKFEKLEKDSVWGAMRVVLVFRARGTLFAQATGNHISKR